MIKLNAMAVFSEKYIHTHVASHPKTIIISLSFSILIYLQLSLYHNDKIRSNELNS